MRATFVGSRKKEELRKSFRKSGEGDREMMDTGTATTTTHRDSETLEERKLRQAAEREKISRQMEEGIDGSDVGQKRNHQHSSGKKEKENYPSSASGKEKSSTATTRRRATYRYYPPHFPSYSGTDGNGDDSQNDISESLTSFEKLQHTEKKVFGKLGLKLPEILMSAN
mmetsp:Transcript_9206/g.13161  ORF Transcript_9206/g.13161 Transcript_9206/m.13161 type:complete len:169 (-) Transcript_9206:1051-1557(-)